MYQSVDFGTPLLYLAVAGVIVVFAIPLGIHALLRWRGYRKDSETRRTYVRRRDIGIETGVSGAGIIVALAFVAVCAVGWNQSEKNLVANIESRYEVSDVRLASWNGSWATVELLDGNGVVAPGIEVSFDAVGAPVLRDVAFELDPKHAVEHSLELRQQPATPVPSAAFSRSPLRPQA